jgi:hypothetical protein
MVVFALLVVVLLLLLLSDELVELFVVVFFLVVVVPVPVLLFDVRFVFVFVLLVALCVVPADSDAVLTDLLLRSVLALVLGFGLELPTGFNANGLVFGRAAAALDGAFESRPPRVSDNDAVRLIDLANLRTLPAAPAVPAASAPTGRGMLDFRLIL